jgi:hypothetical protein
VRRDTGPGLTGQAGSDAPSLAVVDDPTETDQPVAATEATASALVAACEEAWAAIQQHHPDLPAVVIVLGSGVERGRLVKLGHWWGGRWVADGQTRGEVLLAGEALHLTSAQVFEVLLHEGAHGLNAARGIKDTSRGGRYHNQRFAAAAREVLLTVRAMPPYGLASTSLSPEGEGRYAGAISALGDAMRIARQIERGITIGAEGDGQQPGKGRDGSEGGEGRRASSVAAGCGCGRKLRMAPTVYAAGPVTCGMCGTEFRTGAERSRQPTTSEPSGADTVVDRTFLDRRRATLNSSNAVSHHPASLGGPGRTLATVSTAEPQAEPVKPLQARLERIRRLAESRTPGAITPSPVQAERLRALRDTPTTTDDRRALASWYQRFGTLEEEPMPARDPLEASRRSLQARALLKADGTLTGPSLKEGGVEVMRGDRVIATATSYDGPPPGTPGTVEVVDTATGAVEIDFATWGRLRAGLAEAIGRYLQLDYVDLAAHPPGPEPAAAALDREASRLLPEVEW